MNYPKRNGFIANKEGYLVTIRYYDCCENVSSIETETPLNIQVGDFVKAEYWQGFSYGYHLEKFEPTDYDLMRVENANKYLDTIAEYACDYYKRLLTISRELLLKTKSKDELTTLEKSEKGKNVILTDEEIAEAITLLAKSIKTMGIAGGSGSSSFWIDLQLRAFHKHANPFKLATAVKNIPPEIDGRVFAGVSTFARINSNSNTNFSISSQNGDTIFRTRLNCDGVTSEYNKDLIEREIVYLDKETINGISAYEYLKNGPFNLLVDKIMNRRDYEEILEAVKLYEKREDRIKSYLSVIKVGVDYWVDEISHPRFNMNDISFRAMCTEILAYSNVNSNFTAEEIERFRNALTQIVLKDILIRGHSALSVDYNPCYSLAKAACLAGINPSFSWKNHVTVYRDEVELPDRVVTIEELEEDRPYVKKSTV